MLSYVKVIYKASVWSVLQSTHDQWIYVLVYRMMDFDNDNDGEWIIKVENHAAAAIHILGFLFFGCMTIIYKLHTYSSDKVAGLCNLIIFESYGYTDSY